MAVDLFPQTMHCEMLLLFERVDYSSQTTSKEETTTPTEKQEETTSTS